MIRVHDIKLYPGQGLKTLKRLVLGRLAIDEEDVREFRIVRQSVDARDKDDIRLVTTAEFEADPALERELLGLGRKKGDATYYRGLRLSRAEKKAVYTAPEPGTETLTGRPAVVGFGPAGMFAALVLAEAGYRPVVLERGKRMDERVRDVETFWAGGPLDPESNVQFGEGGAGTFSDGKLTTGTHDPRIVKVIDELAAAAGRDELRYLAKPHIGTDELRTVVVAIRQKIEALGGEIRFGRKVTGWTEKRAGNRRIEALQTVSTATGETGTIETNAAVFALGHSARDTWRAFCAAGLSMEPKPFSMGVRAEHLQSWIDLAQYGEPAADLKLEPADYKLAVKVKLPRTGENDAAGGFDERGVYTFCMCPGGTVVAAASDEGMVVTNGMSDSDRGGTNANSAVLVDVRPADYLVKDAAGIPVPENSPLYDPLAGVAFQEKYERLAFELGGRDYTAPAERLGDFLKGKTAAAFGAETDSHTRKAQNAPVPTYARGVRWTDISECLPDFVTDALRAAFPLFGRRVRGFDRPDTVLTAVESRSSSPVRIPRGEDGLARARQIQTAVRPDGVTPVPDPISANPSPESEGTAPLDGFYPAGEGAGYAGGIVSAAVDGIRQAEAIIRRFARP